MVESPARADAAPTVTLLDDPDRLVATLTPFRRRLLALLGEPASATGLSRHLEASRQRVNYHLRALEEAGLVELVELRPRRGVTERMVQRRSDVVLVDPTSFDDAGLVDRDRVGLTGIMATAADLLRQATRVGAAAAARSERVAAATLDAEVRVADPAALRVLLDDLAAVVARHDTGGVGLRMRVATMVLPVAASEHHGPDPADGVPPDPAAGVTP